jgi:hypothetical protein
LILPACDYYPSGFLGSVCRRLCKSKEGREDLGGG